MASHDSGNMEYLAQSIAMIQDIIRTSAPGDRKYYEDILKDLQRKEVKQENNFQPAPSASRRDTMLNSATLPTAMESTWGNRKRSLGPADYPEAKRISAQPSPDAPGTPTSAFDVGQVRGSQQFTLPSRPSASHPVVDLTASDPPTPETYPDFFPNPFVDPAAGAFNDPYVDPFAELDNMYRAQPYQNPNVAPQVQGANGFQQPHTRSAPGDAFNQDFVGLDELASFMTQPTAPGGGYGFNQTQPVPNGQPLVPDFPYGEVPYLPGPELPPFMRDGDESDDYGDFPLGPVEADAIEKLLENIKEHGDTPDDREPTPKIMTCELKEYQKIGLKWLLKMENGTAKGGILADEMGLGKTVQALALMCARPSTDPLCKTTLIIAPVALMRQWEKEIERHIHPRHAFKVFLYWGKGKKADFAHLRQYDVVLTTFGTLISEFKQKESRVESMLHEREVNEPGFRRKPAERLALLGHECMWYRIVIDEAHALKNRNSIQSKATVDLQARHRLCMTGTPMMNSVDELYPLLRFLKVSPYMDWSQFNNDIGKPVKHTHPSTRKKAMNRVQIILKSTMLRRQKISKVDGQEICTIPPKHTTIDNVEFSDDEHAIYKGLEAKSQIQFNRYLAQNTVSTNYANILVLLLRLRQACCHPHLIKDLSQPATEGIAEDDLLTRARELRDDVVERLKSAEADLLQCPICFEADPNPTIIIPCGHTVCGVCVQKLIDPARAVQEGNDEESRPKCPQCRGLLEAKLITDYKHFCKVHCPDKLSPEPEDERADSADSDTEEELDEIDTDEVDKNGNLAGFVVEDDEDDEYKNESNTGDENEEDAGPANKETKKAHKGKGKGKTQSQPIKTLALLKKESLRSKAAKKRYLRRLEKTFVTSAKLQKTVEILSEIQKNDPTEKTLVFSQFTSLLDLVEVPLLQKRIRYQRYDGSMKMDERADAVNTFMDDPNQNVMLVSLKAGNAGLNLWKASQVIILDPFWNPFVEEQAVDRAHRMPQTREVTVHRVLVPETVEDRICKLQDKKREIIGAALDENASKNISRLNVRELRFLFGF